jgi:hypothetical protein
VIIPRWRPPPRSPFLVDWSARACLAALDQSLNAITGQVTAFNRPGVSTALDANGNTKIAAYGQPNYQWAVDPVSGLSVPGLLLQQQTLPNIAPFPNDQSSWSTHGSVSVTPNSTLAPDGTTTADTVTRVSGVADYTIDVIPFTSDGSKALGIYVKQGSGSTNLIGLFDNTASAYRYAFVVRWSGGVPSTGGFTTGSGSVTFTAAANGFYKVDFVANAVQHAHTNQLLCLPSDGFGVFGGGANGDSIIAWGAYAIDAPSSVVADSFAIATGLVPMSMTMYVSLRQFDGGYGSHVASLSNASFGPPYLGLFSNGTANGQVYSRYYDGVTAPTLVGPAVAAGAKIEYRVAVYPDGHIDLGTSKNGAAESTTTDATTSTFPTAFSTPTTMQLLTGGSYMYARLAAGVQSLSYMRNAV